MINEGNKCNAFRKLVLDPTLGDPLLTNTNLIYIEPYGTLTC